LSQESNLQREDDMTHAQSNGPGPTVFVVDNDAAVRTSLAWLLESVGLRVATFKTAEEFLAAYGADQPGCLVLDVRLPGMSGPVLQEELERLEMSLPVIMITGFADVPTAVRVLKRGAFDFFEKPLVDDLLLERVQQAIDADALCRCARAERQRLNARLSCLTAREREVFDQIVQGKANKVVAYELGISEKTVEVHRARVMQKACAGSLAELVRMDLLAGQRDALRGVPIWLTTGLTSTRHNTASQAA
jgi:FixJ family two-component response regulator